MQGFENSHAPVVIRVQWLKVDGTTEVIEVPMDGKRAIATEYGVLATIGTTRWFVPWARVQFIKQELEAEVTPPNEPIAQPLHVTPPDPAR